VRRPAARGRWCAGLAAGSFRARAAPWFRAAILVRERAGSGGSVACGGSLGRETGGLVL
jgi:hypothetical protein